MSIPTCAFEEAITENWYCSIHAHKRAKLVQFETLHSALDESAINDRLTSLFAEVPEFKEGWYLLSRSMRGRGKRSLLLPYKASAEKVTFEDLEG